MSQNLTIMEIGVLMAQFSALPASERQHFLRQHPEIQSAPIVDWALMAARTRGQMGEPEARIRYAEAALYIAMQIGDAARQAAAHQLLAEP